MTHKKNLANYLDRKSSWEKQSNMWWVSQKQRLICRGMKMSWNPKIPLYTDSFWTTHVSTKQSKHVFRFIVYFKPNKFFFQKANLDRGSHISGLNI